MSLETYVALNLDDEDEDVFITHNLDDDEDQERIEDDDS